MTSDKTKLAGLVSAFVKPDISVVLGSFSNITFEIERGRVAIRISGIDIRDFSIVYIRSIGKSNSFMAGILAYYLKRTNVKLINSRFEYSRALSDKLTSLVILALNDFPVIPSFFCARENIKVNIEIIIEKFSFPVVAKNTISHHSKGIFVLREREDFEKFLRNESVKKTDQFLFQKFVPLESEYRLLVLGGRVATVQKMYRDLSGSGSKIDYYKKEEFQSLESVSNEMKMMAVSSAKSLDMQVAGVDTMISKHDGKEMLIEVNSSPGFTFDTEISPEILELSRYLKKEALE